MSSKVATKVAPKKRIVVERTKIHGGYAVSIKIPGTATVRPYPSGDKAGSTYLEFSRTVRGGKVYLFCHDATAIRDRNVTMMAEVWQKKMDNGTVYPYIDLKLPTDPDANPTHTLVLEAYSVEQGLREVGSDYIDLSFPLDGSIVFKPIKKNEHHSPKPKKGHTGQ